VYRITFSRGATKVLIRMPRNVALNIRAKLDDLAKDPFAQNNNVKALVGNEGYRLRVGDWRIIYRVEKDRLEILVLRIGTRGGVYQ
jgi:mRNA interferase RelE/StbE